MRPIYENLRGSGTELGILSKWYGGPLVRSDGGREGEKDGQQTQAQCLEGMMTPGSSQEDAKKTDWV